MQDLFARVVRAALRAVLLALRNCLLSFEAKNGQCLVSYGARSELEVKTETATSN